MKANSYYRICRHPKGGYAAVLGCLTNLQDGFQAAPSLLHREFLCWEDAYTYARRHKVAYGVHVDPDIFNAERIKVLIHSYPQEAATILRDMGYEVAAPSV